MDAVCTGDGNLPLLSPDFDLVNWEKPILSLMTEARQALERLAPESTGRVAVPVSYIEACIAARIETKGFGRLIATFSDEPHFVAELADQFMSHADKDKFGNRLLQTLQILHSCDASLYQERARLILELQSQSLIRAPAYALRVTGTTATEEDIALIKAYGAVSDTGAKAGALHAIAYMGRYEELRPHLLDAALSIQMDGDPYIASELADAFGPYGVPISMMTRAQAATLLSRFISVKDWDSHQGSIPRFLTALTNLFPDEVFDFLLNRIAAETLARQQNDYSFRSFDLVHNDISFGGLPSEKRAELAARCLGILINDDSSTSSYAELFWVVGGYTEGVFNIIVGAASRAHSERVTRIATLINKAAPRLAFTYTEFAKRLIDAVVGQDKTKIIEALASQAGHLPSGPFAGEPSDFLSAHYAQVSQGADAISEEPGLDQLTRAIRQSMRRE
jgi:hypothetical protein